MRRSSDRILLLIYYAVAVSNRYYDLNNRDMHDSHVPHIPIWNEYMCEYVLICSKLLSSQNLNTIVYKAVVLPAHSWCRALPDAQSAIIMTQPNGRDADRTGPASSRSRQLHTLIIRIRFPYDDKPPDRDGNVMRTGEAIKSYTLAQTFIVVGQRRRQIIPKVQATPEHPHLLDAFFHVAEHTGLR